MMISHSNVKLPDAMVVNWVLYTTDDMLNIVKCYMLYIYSLVYILYLDIIMVWTSIESAAFSCHPAFLLCQESNG